MLDPIQIRAALVEAGHRKVELNNEQPHLPSITFPDTLEAEAAQVISNYIKREQDLLEANNRYLDRARHAENLAGITAEPDGYLNGNVTFIAAESPLAIACEKTKPLYFRPQPNMAVLIERERCAHRAYEAALYSGVSIEAIAQEIADAVRMAAPPTSVSGQGGDDDLPL